MRVPSEYVLFRPGQPTEEKSVYYLIAGLVRLDVPRASAAPFPYYVHPGGILGLPETLLRAQPSIPSPRWSRSGRSRTAGIW